VLIKQHFGNPLIEQRNLSEGKAVCVLDKKAIVQVTGEDRLSWLHSLLSQDIKNLKPGDSTQALLLDPQGRIEQLIQVVDDGVSSWLMVDMDSKTALIDWLSKMVFRMKVQLSDQSENYFVIGAVFDDPGLASESNGVPLIFEEKWPGVTPGGYRYSNRNVSYSWFEHILAADLVETAVSSKLLAGTMAADALRVASGKPKAPNELDDKTLPHELDLLATAVHLTKGCYRGQESVAKVHNLGHPPRRLTFLHLDGSEHDLPDIGDELRVLGEEKIRGKVTSVTQHFEMGPIALAMIQRATAEDALLEILSKNGNIAATQEIIVPQSAGSVANIPKLPRLSLGAKAKPAGS
jgi:tRNA-modifying protein YgfZ